MTAIPVIKLEPGAALFLKSLLACKDTPLRIELKNSGCCDSSLGLRADKCRETDLLVKCDDLIFLITPETYQITRDITISYIDEPGKRGIMLTSSQPVSEWAGFALSDIQI